MPTGRHRCTTPPRLAGSRWQTLLTHEAQVNPDAGGRTPLDYASTPTRKKCRVAPDERSKTGAELSIHTAAKGRRGGDPATLDAGVDVSLWMTPKPRR